jgi:Coenzyme PQQ synthesis protein D (PqqD)
MKSNEKSALPRARVEGLVVKELPDEVLVYDLDTHKAHCLNHTAALIWKHFDGKATIAEVASRAASEGGHALDSEVVLLALRQLRKAKLMLADGDTPKIDGHLSRRDVIKRIGLAATALPLVTSILAPTASASISCGSHPCTSSAECAAWSTECTTCISLKCK